MAKYIKLPCGRRTLVDNEDYERLKGYFWASKRTDQDRTRYVMAHIYHGKGCNPKVTTILLHRMVLNLKPFKEDSMYVDHINHNGLDNRKENLRLVTCSQNGANRQPNKKKGTSKYKGVGWHPHGKWVARIRNKGRLQHLGYFEDEIEAAKAYNRAAQEIFGEYALINKI